LVLGFNLLVIIWGALVRATRSGEGCGDHWPLCNGTVLPHAAQIATIIEFTHRSSTGLALISVVFLAVWAFRAFPAGRVRKAAAASAMFIVTEALLGAGLVLFHYTGEDASIGRAVYLSAHLINTLLMLGAIALTAWWGAGHGAIRLAGSKAKPIGAGLLAGLLIAVTGSINALSDTLFPATSLLAGWEADFAAGSNFLIRLRVWHPVVAVLAGASIAMIALVIRGRTLRPRARQMASTVAGLVGVQIAAGVINIWMLAPIWMQLTHLLLADLLWIALVLFSAAVLEDQPGGGP
jgi:heme a synthase